MNKSLQQKILFTIGGVIAVFGLVFFQHKFPSSLDSSRLLGQPAVWWSPNDCPEYQDTDAIIENGNFSDGPPDNTSVSSFKLSICGWQRNSNPSYDLGVKHYDNEEQESIPFALHNPLNSFPSISNDERYIGLISAEHFSSSWGQTHDYLAQNVSGRMEPGQNYTVFFEYYTVPNSAGTWVSSEDLSAGIAILFLDENQFSYLNSTNNYSTCNYPSPFLFCGEDRDYSSADQFIQILENNFESPINFAYLSPDNELSSTEQWSSFSTTFTYPTSAPSYVVFIPVGYNPEYAYSFNYKVKTLLLLDNISIDPALFTCGVTFSGEGELFYNNLQGEYVPYVEGGLNIEEIGNTAPISVNQDSFYMYSPVPGYLNIKTPPTVEYTTEDILNLFSLQGGETISATVFSGSNFWIEYECFESCENVPEDFNQDGTVDSLDVEFFMNFFGQSCSSLESCPFDFDGNGIITVQDLMVLIGSVGEQCGLPLLTDASESVDDQDSDSGQNNFYQSNGNFVKPSKIPRLEKTYNYIVNTKILDTKQSSLQIQNFFPNNMILQGLYSSTKNISLISKEGIVKFFDLGNITNIQSYLYLQASDEVCAVVSKNKKAYEEVVSYGICK